MAKQVCVPSVCQCALALLLLKCLLIVECLAATQVVPWLLVLQCVD